MSNIILLSFNIYAIICYMKINFREIVVKNPRQKENIYTYLKANGYSENYLKNLRKQKGFIKLNGNICFINQPVKNNDVICVNDNPNTKTCINSCNIPLDIVFEDDQVLAINKPSGLATMPSRSHYDYNLSGGLVNYFGDDFVVRIVNRLDKEASGIVLVACNSLASNFLNKYQNVKKTYYALLEGNLSSDIVIEKNIHTICKNGKNEVKRIVSDTLGKPAKTEVYLIKNYDGYCLVKINITFGRTHQIRVHLSSVGHALLGDKLYGKKSNLISHTALCLKEVEFVHPLSQSVVKLSIDLPQDMQKLV